MAKFADVGMQRRAELITMVRAGSRLSETDERDLVHATAEDLLTAMEKPGSAQGMWDVLYANRNSMQVDRILTESARLADSMQ